jgi:hypothetical protein
MTEAEIQLSDKMIYTVRHDQITRQITVGTVVISARHAADLGRFLATQIIEKRKMGQLRGFDTRAVAELAAILYGKIERHDDGTITYFTAERSIDRAIRMIAESNRQKSSSKKPRDVVANISPQYVMMMQTDKGTIAIPIGSTALITLENAAEIVASHNDSDKKFRWLEIHQAGNRQIVPFDEIKSAKRRLMNEILIAKSLIERAM